MSDEKEKRNSNERTVLEREQRVLEFIQSQAQKGIPPSVRDICDKMNFKSTSTAARYINSLAEKGLIEKLDNQSRGIRLAGKSSSKIPLMGKITAGQPITAVSNIAEYINFHEDNRYSGELFALRVEGDSMVNAAILDGDIVVIENCRHVRNGTIAAILIDGEEATVKTFFKEDGHYRLQPENDNFEPIIVDECEIIGKVVAVLRYL